MRASRLVQLLLLLQTNGKMTASRLARELEVSVRTIYRDIEALSGAGVPIYAESGPGGGVRLVDGYRTRLTGLTAHEAEALALSGLPGAASELGLGTVLAAAQLKVDAALPPELRSRAVRMRERFHLDAPGWFAREEAVPHLAALSRAVWDSERVELRYAKRDGEVRRVIDPLGLVLKAGVWYLVALSGRTRSVRTFRVSRVQSVRPLDEPAERPDDFALATAWEDVVGEVERRRSRTWATVLLEARFVPVLRGHFGRHCHTDEVLDDGRARVRIAAPTPLDIARNLAGWGAAVAVVAPESVQLQLARIGAELAARYAPAAE